MSDADVIIVGSGPAGVSCAFPLLEAGHRVLMVDGGREMPTPALKIPYLEARRTDPDQWKWMVGPEFHALRNMDAVSPKLRIPGFIPVFEGFGEANSIRSQDFNVVGSLASGGLSNVWGCGVARYSEKELAAFPCPEGEMAASYAKVAERIGISGATDDDLSGYFGLDEWAEAPLAADVVQGMLLARYNAHRLAANRAGIRMGRSRVAALSQPRETREANALNGNCLWGCHQRSLYSAAFDLEDLLKHPLFSYRPGAIVDQIEPGLVEPAILARTEGSRIRLTASRIVLAAGTLATTRLAMRALELTGPIQLKSNPTAAFLVWSPIALGRAHQPAFGLGQISFVASLANGDAAFGSLFNTTGIPASEFARHVPFGRRQGIDLLRHLLSSCAAGNLFLPGHYSDTQVRLSACGTLNILGAFRDDTRSTLFAARKKLSRFLPRIGAVLVPGSFTMAVPGSDIHYASTLPMRKNPKQGETGHDGTLAGLQNIHVVDGACLPILTEKPHTLTLMANADRIGRLLGRRQPAA